MEKEENLDDEMTKRPAPIKVIYAFHTCRNMTFSDYAYV